jgi:tetratricopeptide (TPR) repeat protein
MSDRQSPEQVLQSILKDIQVGGNLTTGDINQILNLLVIVKQPDSFNPTGIPQNIPSSGTIRFVGRFEELERLHQMLQQNNQVVIAAIEGMGGVGKTELATQYALLHLLLLTYPGGICWLRARDEDVGIQIVRFAQAKLGLNPPEDWDLPSQVDFCWSRWHEGNVLVVLDDVNDYPKVEPYLPRASRFKVLITTRLQLDLPQSLTLDVLDESAALELLREWIGEEKINHELADAKELCQRLGYLPLALNLVGRYVKKRKISLAEMLRRLEKKGLKHESLERDKNYPAWTLNVRRGVAAAFELSWEELSQEAKQLGGLLSLFALAPISWALVESVEIEQDSEYLEDARVELESLHLIQGEETYRLHQLIREFFQEKLEQLELADKLKQAFATVMAAVAEQIPHPDSLTLDLINAIAHSISHIEEATTTLTDFLTDEEIILSTAGLGKFYQGRGFYERAEFWLEKYLFFMEDRVGLDHPYVAVGLNNIGYLYYAQGRYADAELAYKLALKLWQRWMTDGDAFIASILNNLALLYDIQDDFSKAEPLFEQALQIRKRLFGEEHLDVAMSLNNLAAVYEAQKRYDKAESLYQQALKLKKRLLGDEHPNVSQTLNNLAYLYYIQGRYSEAEPIYQQALEIDQRLLGNEHLNVASNLNNLAALYGQQGHYDKAERLFRRSLELRKHLLGEHPYVAESLSNLARVCCSQGGYSEALPLYWQALAICEQQLGLNHTKTVTAQENFAVCLRQAILKGCADIESLPNNLTVQAILATVQASLEKSE